MPGEEPTDKSAIMNMFGKVYIIKYGLDAHHLFNLRKTGTPAYLFVEMPTERTPKYDLRGTRVYDIAFSKTKRFSNTYFANVLHERKKL